SDSDLEAHAPSARAGRQGRVTRRKRSSTPLAAQSAMAQGAPIGRLHPPAAVPASRVGDALQALHRGAHFAGPARSVPPQAGRNAETVLSVRSGAAAYNLFVDSKTGKVTTDLSLNGNRLDGFFGRRALLLEEGVALRP